MESKISITKVFFDSDAIIAGSASKLGAAFVLLQLSELRLIQGYTSRKVIDECRKNLQIKLPDALPAFEQIITHSLAIVENPSKNESDQNRQMAHEKDLPILAAALKIHAQYLVTFNIKDFYPPPDTGLIILKPGDLLIRIRAKLSEIGD